MRDFINITEYAYTKVAGDYRNQVIVAINPTNRELKKLVDSSSHGSIRGLYYEPEDIFYFWDASENTHADMANKLGIPSTESRRLDLFSKSSTGEYVAHMNDLMKDHQYIQKNFIVGKQQSFLKGTKSTVKEQSIRDFITLSTGKLFESLDPTSSYNRQIADFLNREGIKFDEINDTIYVDRTSMVIYAKGFEENDAHTYVLELIKERLPENLYITWAGRSDEWLGIDVYEKNYSR